MTVVGGVLLACGMLPSGMFETILVPTKRRAEDDAAERRAVDIAAIHDGEVVGLFVADPRATPVSTKLSAEEVTDVFLEDTDHPARTLESLAQERDVPVSRATRVGRPASEIVACAEAIDADLVVMDTHARSGLKRHLLGSTTERTLRQSDVPVLCIPVSE